MFTIFDCLSTHLQKNKRQSCHHREASQMICCKNQLTGFYVMATLVFNKLIVVGSQIEKCLDLGLLSPYRVKFSSIYCA